MRVEHEICSTICGTPVQAIWDHKDLIKLAWGSGKVKICPRMAWIWLWSRPEAPKLVNEPWNGPKWFPQLPVIDLSRFPDLVKHYSHDILKKYQFSYIVKIIDFWNFHFSRLSWPTESLFERFRDFPQYTIWWYTKENYETFQKVAQLAMKNG